MRSVHDNFVYAYCVISDKRRLILHLHTDFRGGGAKEYTDVIFSGVEAHDLVCELEGNILFDVVEVEPEKIIKEYGELFAQKKNHCWPQIEYSDPPHLVEILKQRKIKAFEVLSSYGL